MTVTGVVLRSQSGFFWVQTADAVLRCRLRGRLKKDRQRSDLAVIGDRVEVEPISPDEGAITYVHPRQSRFSRQQPGPRGQWREDVLIANLDQVVIVMACANPDWNARMLDRFLMIAEHNQIAALIVANKTDLLAPAQVAALVQPYAQIDYPVFATSTHTGAGIASLRERLAGRVSVFTGMSGVGKSSLLNALQPGLQLATGAVSATLNKGRHTTVVAELHPLSDLGGGYVADTPGIRELAAWRIPDADVAWCFREMRPFLGQCEFNNCLHTHEPNCAIQAAVATGEISPARYESYVRILEKQERSG